MGWRAIVEVWMDGFVALFGIALRGLVVWLFLMAGRAAIMGHVDGQFEWANWAALAWLPLCVGLEIRRVKRELSGGGFDGRR